MWWDGVAFYLYCFALIGMLFSTSIFTAFGMYISAISFALLIRFI